MERFYTISHKGKKIVVLDYSNTSPEEAIAFFADAHRRIATYPPKSALIFADATQARFNEASVAAIKEFAAKNTPYVKASASIGTPGLQGVIPVS